MKRGSREANEGLRDIKSAIKAATLRKASSDTIAVSKAIKDSVRKAESAAVVENAIRWCSNIIVEVHSSHGLNLTKAQYETLKELSLMIQKASTAIRSH